MAKSNIQRALVLQGGGSLGAYEAGVLESVSQILVLEPFCYLYSLSFRGSV